MDVNFSSVPLGSPLHQRLAGYDDLISVVEDVTESKFTNGYNGQGIDTLEFKNATDISTSLVEKAIEERTPYRLHDVQLTWDQRLLLHVINDESIPHRWFRLKRCSSSMIRLFFICLIVLAILAICWQLYSRWTTMYKV